MVRVRIPDRPGFCDARLAKSPVARVEVMKQIIGKDLSRGNDPYG